MSPPRQLSPLQRAFLLGLRHGRRQARKETARLESDIELASVEAAKFAREGDVEERTLDLELGLPRDRDLEP